MNALRLWLKNGGECLNLWMETGVLHPGEQASGKMAAWLAECREGGWHELADAGEMLLNDSTPAEEKAGALNLLCLWFEMIRFEFERDDLKAAYGVN